MKKLVLLVAISCSALSSFAQPAGMVNETFNLKSIETNNLYLTPNGENPTLTFYELPGSHVLDADGIFNTLTAGVNFSGNTLTLHSNSVTLHDCVEPNCYYENLYFYEILTNQNLESKTLTYNYNERNGYKYLSLRDSEYNRAYFSTEPAPIPDALLFQTWYLYMIEADVGDPIFFDGPNPPQITINSDFTYTGSEDCALISGDFILGNKNDYYDFILQSRNYVTDETNCPPGPVDYAMWQLEYGIPMGSYVFAGSNGYDSFFYETSPGFMYHFGNAPPLSISENTLASLKIYPNPTQNKLIIQSATTNFNSVIITDIHDRIIISSKDVVSNEIDVSALKPGMYFISIESSEVNNTKKFIKE